MSAARRGGGQGAGPVGLQLVVPYFQLERPLNWPALFGREAPLDVEIGFGLGEFLTRTARQAPDRNFVGLELDWLRMKKTLRKITAPGPGEPPLENVRVIKVDAAVALRRFFRPAEIEKIYCLFPCPWPKKGHVQNRLFSQDFLRLTNSRLVDQGRVQIVTDFEPYFQWVREQVPETGFAAEYRTVAPRFGTKFERKWCQGGQEEFFEISLRKERHWAIPVEEDQDLKVYFIDDFSPERFRFEDEVGEGAVVCKDFIFDPQRKKGMVHLVVAERELTQHLWVIVVHSARGWCVAKAEGQTILPTPGVAEAIRLTAEAVRRSGSATLA